MDKMKHHVLVGLLLVALGLVSTYLLRVFHFSENYNFVQTFAVLACGNLIAAGGVLIFLHFVNGTKR